MCARVSVYNADVMTVHYAAQTTPIFVQVFSVQKTWARILNPGSAGARKSKSNSMSELYRPAS